MTSDEIKDSLATDIGERAWLREICLQVALMNEKLSPTPPVAPPAPVIVPQHVKRPYHRKVAK